MGTQHSHISASMGLSRDHLAFDVKFKRIVAAMHGYNLILLMRLQSGRRFRGYRLPVTEDAHIIVTLLETGISFSTAVFFLISLSH